MSKLNKFYVKYEETIEELSYTFTSRFNLDEINEDWDYFEDKIISEIEKRTDGRLKILNIVKAEGDDDE